MKLLLISGHGAGDPGATSVINGKQYREADETRRMTAAIASALSQSCQVAIYPTDRNAFEDHKKGTLPAIAKFSQYDYVLEIHFNAISPGKKDGKTKGVECFVTTEEPKTDVEELLCRKIAVIGLTNRGVKRYNWSVIHAARKAGVSSALLEVCFIDDPDDMAVYTANITSIAAGIAEAIRETFLLEKEEIVTYDEFKSFLERYLTEQSQQAPSAWSADARKWAEDAGLIAGNDKGQKKYKSAVTREELVQILFRLQ